MSPCSIPCRQVPLAINQPHPSTALDSAHLSLSIIPTPLVRFSIFTSTSKLAIIHKQTTQHALKPAAKCHHSRAPDHSVLISQSIIRASPYRHLVRPSVNMLSCFQLHGCRWTASRLVLFTADLVCCCSSYPGQSGQRPIGSCLRLFCRPARYVHHVRSLRLLGLSLRSRWSAELIRTRDLVRNQQSMGGLRVTA